MDFLKNEILGFDENLAVVGGYCFTLEADNDCDRQMSKVSNKCAYLHYFLII